MSGGAAVAFDAVGPGLADPVHGAQASFRAVLEAMSRPGRVQTLPADLLAGTSAPGLGVAATAVLLSLLDAQVRLWLSPDLRNGGAADFLRFHTGAAVAGDLAVADIVVMRTDEAEPALWAALSAGTDAAPHDGATLLLDACGLQPPAPRYLLRGPGIETAQPLHVAGLREDFWAARRALEPGYPCGVELLLCDGVRMAALPRTTRLDREG